MTQAQADVDVARTIRTATTETQATLTVSNDGNPIEEHLREKIFERFFRAGTDGQGSGLGVPITRCRPRSRRRREGEQRKRPHDVYVHDAGFALNADGWAGFIGSGV
ncbi:MAG: hypothetical protein M3R35_07800 [Candidatus Eremiobacteraeota bacterium]|nr:hypothetical protein [Candidatus Eremiobacteraeota bacterium]